MVTLRPEKYTSRSSAVLSDIDVISSTMPSQSSSRASHASTPALVFTHSQPLLAMPSASKKSVKQVNLHMPATHAGFEFGIRHELKQVPQFEMSVCRSGELLLHIGMLPPVPPAPEPLAPPAPPAVPPRPPLPPTPPSGSGGTSGQVKSVDGRSIRPPSATTSTPKS